MTVFALISIYSSDALREIYEIFFGGREYIHAFESSSDQTRSCSTYM